MTKGPVEGLVSNDAWIDDEPVLRTTPISPRKRQPELAPPIESTVRLDKLH